MLITGRDNPYGVIHPHGDGIRIRVDFTRRPDARVEIALSDTDIKAMKFTTPANLKDAMKRLEKVCAHALPLGIQEIMEKYPVIASKAAIALNTFCEELESIDKELRDV